MAGAARIKVVEPTPEETGEAQEQRIRDRAYEIYLQRGDEAGTALDDWLQAEAEIGGTQKQTEV